MEWSWCWNGNGNDMTPFMLYESSGDSEDVKFINNDHHHEATMINECEESVSFRYDDIEDVVIDDHDDDDDDDAQSCSYDHSSYAINTSYGNNRHHDDHQFSQRLYDVSDVLDDHHNDDDDDGSDKNDDDDDDDYKNWGESKLLDPFKKQNMSHKFCGESLNPRDADKQFWESCLAS